MSDVEETLRGPNWSASPWKPDPYLKHDGRSMSAGFNLATVEVNTFQHKAEVRDVPIIRNCSMGVEGPNARASCGVSNKGIGGMAQLSAGKISSEVGCLRGELNPNLTTGATFGANGLDTRFGGSGASISPRGLNFHTPLGSAGFNWKK